LIPAALLTRLRQGSRFLITSHLNPDGDAIGSELGLARVLGALGKSTTIWNVHPTPALYRPLPGSERIHVGLEAPAGFPGAFDAAVVLECPGLDRTGLEQPLRALPLINVDHHLGNQLYGAVNWTDTESAAVGVMVFELARALGVRIDGDTASCLYLALVTDTGGFRFSNATPATFESAARLVAAGARVETVSQWLYESQPAAAVRLLGHLLGTLELSASGRVAAVHLTRAMFAAAGASAGDSEGLIDVPRSIAGVEAVVMLREIDAGEWKVSLRSRGEVDVESVASARGGGGHRNAAGCKAAGDRESVARELTVALERAIEEAHGR